MKNKIRDEIEWVVKLEIQFTSLIIWNKMYEPFQVAIFRKKIADRKILIKYYTKIDKFIKFNEFTIDFKDESENEIMFYITLEIRNYIDNYCSKCSHLNLNQEEDQIENHDYDHILEEVFSDSMVIDAYKINGPDFGFYSLSVNFFKLKKLILDGVKPNINEEFDRLRDKYK